VNRRKLQRRSERAARLYSKWAFHRLMQEYTKQSFARMDQWLDANPIRYIDLMRYGRHAFPGGRRITDSIIFNIGA